MSHVSRSVAIVKVIGIMSIEMAGAVYCPLSPRDPQQRLQGLIEQTQSRLVVVHWMTREKLEVGIVAIDVDAIVSMNTFRGGFESDVLSTVLITSDSIAYVIFTSGSTGTPKAVSVSHERIFSFLRDHRYILGPSSSSELHRFN